MPASSARGLVGVGPAFEVATIRAANRDDGRKWFGMRLDASGRFQTSAVDMRSLVSLAYAQASKRVKVIASPTAPKWVSTDRFDIQAKVDDAYMAGWGHLSDEQRMNVVRPMIRQLLTDRFHATLRVETRTTPVYALVQAKGGAHVKEVPPPIPPEGDPVEAQAQWFTDHPGKAYQGTVLCSGDGCVGHAVTIGAAIGQIAANARADRMVVDETGLTGYYDLAFPFPTPKAEFPLQEVADSLGVKFVPRSVPIQTYLLESAERPNLDGTEVR